MPGMTFERNLDEHLEVVGMLRSLKQDLLRAAELTSSAIASKNMIMFCGNGGSAADSQHLAAEFVGKFLKDRTPLPAMSLTVNCSQLTAIGNDFGFDEIFSREIEASGKSGDVLFALSTSGNSDNVIKAAIAAKKKGITVIGMTGSSGGKLEACCDVCLRIPSESTPRIQEAHIFVGHTICEIAESTLC